MNASLLSDWEFCARLPRLKLSDPLQRPSVRDAVKDAFAFGIQQVAERNDNAPTDAAEKFIDAAMTGFVYPSGEPYTLAQDYAAWLDGALRLVQETQPRLQPLAPATINGTEFDCGAYADSGQIVAYRVAGSLDYTPRWPDLLIQAQYEQALTIRLLRLPPARDGRLPSPLNLGYKHPVNGQIRLARIQGEKVSFGNSWTRVGRWELPEVEWREWRVGIDRDQCMNLIYAEQEQEALTDGREVLKDASRIVEEIMSGEMEPPRHREGCQSCQYLSVCHPAVG